MLLTNQNAEIVACILLTGKFSRTTTIQPGIFLGRALWADSVSPLTNTGVSRDQFKSIRIGEKFSGEL